MIQAFILALFLCNFVEQLASHKGVFVKVPKSSVTKASHSAYNISCTVKATNKNPIPLIKWQHNGYNFIPHPTNRSINARVYITETLNLLDNTRTSSILFRSLRRFDSGYYGCYIPQPENIWVRSIHLKVEPDRKRVRIRRSSPDVLVTSEITITPKKKMEITCRPSDGNTNYYVTFCKVKKRSKECKNDADIIAESSSKVSKTLPRVRAEQWRLILDPAELSDVGHYLCRLKSQGHENKVEKTFSIRHIPFVVQKDSTIIIDKDKDLRQVCQGISDPQTDIIWTRRPSKSSTLYQHLESSSEDGRITIRTFKSNMTSELTMHKLRYSDEGYYSCTFSNEFGKQKWEFHLRVRDRPWITPFLVIIIEVLILVIVLLFSEVYLKKRRKNKKTELSPKVSIQPASNATSQSYVYC